MHIVHFLKIKPMTLYKICEKIKMHHPLQILALLFSVCFSLSSCAPWENELEGIYEAARSGDRLSQFAIIEEYHSFQDRVPEDTIQVYLWRFIKEGNHRAIDLAAIIDLNKLSYSTDYAEQSDRIHLKWANEGIRHNNYLSYEYLADRHMDRYRKTGHLQDSLNADELYEKAIKAGHKNLMLKRDIKAGIGAVITGGIEYGKYSYRNIFNDRKCISRFTFSCSYAYAYIVSGAMKLLFTSEWWKVLLTLLGMLALLLVPIAPIIYALPTGSEGNIAGWGTLFGFWNSMCFFTAVSKHNIVWLNNTGSLLFHPSSYGLQQYLSITMNQIALLYIIIAIYKAIRNGRRDMMNLGEIIKNAVFMFIIFTVCYLVAQIGGYLLMYGALALVGLLFAAGAATSAPSAAIDTVFSSESTSDGQETDNSAVRLHHYCYNCRYWDARNRCCERDGRAADEYNSCDLWTLEW